MEVARLRRRSPDADSYAWTFALARPAGPGRVLRPEAMNASEQMFFFGAPLAHVVQYEDHLKAVRHERAAKDLARGGRLSGFASQMAALRALPGAAE
jgi:hypothetical protein